MRQVIWYSLHISLLHLVGCLETSTQGALNHHHFPFSQELDESGHKPFTSGRWDQFKANEELFGYVSTYKAGSDPSLEMMAKNQGCFWLLGNWPEADVFETHGIHACVGYFCLGRFWKIQ